MKKLNERGFTLAEGLLLALLVLLVAGIGSYVYSKNNETETSTITSQSNNQQTTEEKTTSRYITVIPDGEVVSIFKPGDEEKLPETIPASFKAYMKGQLAKNTKPDDSGCYSGYVVREYSPVNVKGGVYSVGSNGRSSDECFGGAGAYWYEKDQRWDVLTTQVIVSCKSLSKTTIYEEFIPTCIASENVEDIKPNPNGSIDDVMAKEN